ELDYGMHNVRGFDNFIWNVFDGISMQPVFGGPAYVFRNVVYNCTRMPIKPNEFPAGLLIYHNTFVANGSAGTFAPLWQNSQIVNNLFLGTGERGAVIKSGTLTPKTSRMDYNGWRWFESARGPSILWHFPEPVP